MASTDRKHEKKLREAEKEYNKWKKAFLAGKITKEELKERLRPFKYELHELNLVKLKEGDLPPKETEEEEEAKEEEKKVIDVKEKVSYSPWSKRSSLTIEEIEERVDLLSLGSRPSETLQMLYEKRYGEDLSPPEDLISYHVEAEVEDDDESGLPPSRREELPEFDDAFDDSRKNDDEDGEDGGEKKEKKPFWKGLLKRKKGEA
jgi:hypothetical protein